MELDRWSAHRKELGRRRRCPETNVLYRLVYHYRDKLQWSWEELFQSQYGVLRDEVLESLDKFLDCGILIHGCARAVCETCGHTELIAFSCKRRCICSSCDAKRAVIFAEHLSSSILPALPISHQVYTIPKRLRPYFKFNRKLNRHLYHAAWGAWCDLIEDELPGAKPGAVMALHTAGDLVNWHPHVHSLMLYGARDGAGDFQPLDSVNVEYLTARFARRVLGALLGEGLIDQETVENILSWEHSGFHVFVGEPIGPENQESRRFVAQYLKKSPVSLARLELIETGPEPVLRCRSYNSNLAEHKDFGPLQFLAELSQHIPDEFEQTVRYLGTLSARTRGAERLQKPVEPIVKLSELEPAPAPSRSWAACMKRVFEIDPLCCPSCGGKMQIKAFTLDRAQIEKLCGSLGIAASRAPPAIKSAPIDLVA